MNPLPEKKHFTAKECADAWGLTVQDLLQYGAYGKIELMVYLELTEGTMYVFRKGKSPREEIKRSAWGGSRFCHQWFVEIYRFIQISHVLLFQ